MPDRIDWIAGPAGFEALEEPWERLVAGANHPFSDHAWLRAWWRAFGGEAELRVCTAWCDGELEAALPAGRRHGRLFGLSNYHQPLFEVPARDEGAGRAVLDASLSEAGELFLHGLAADDRSLADLRSLCDERGRLLLVEPAHKSPIVDTTGDFGAYEGGVSSTLRRARRKLHREHAAALRIDDGGPDFEAALQRGFELEGSGWKSEAGTAILSHPETTTFYSELARAYRSRGELRLAWLDVDGEPVAFNFCIEHGRRLYLLKTGFEQEHRALTPGLVLNFLIAEHCFNSELDAYELLGDAEDWKLKLSTGTRDHVRAWAYRPRPLRIARYLIRKHAVPLARRVRSRTRVEAA
jgi:CelD/BcsL family acetyltransferase involved in cellulose biosynthesis